MLTAQGLRHLISDAPDLGLLAAFARDVPNLQGSHFCMFPQERAYFFDDSDDEEEEAPKPPPPVERSVNNSSSILNTIKSNAAPSTAASSPSAPPTTQQPAVSPPSGSTTTAITAAVSTPSPVLLTSAQEAAPSSTAPPSRRRDGSSVGFTSPPPETKLAPSSSSQQSTVAGSSSPPPPPPPSSNKAGPSSSSSSSSSGGAITIPRGASSSASTRTTQISSPPTSTFSAFSRATSSNSSNGASSNSSTPSTSSSSSSSAAANDAAGFVWGDFGGLKDHGDTYHNRRQSRVFGTLGGVGGGNSAQVEGDASSWGDFSYFVPKSVSEPPSVNKQLEQSFNRSMVRRSSVAHHHKVLDELEDSPEDDHDSDGKTNSFSFSDFSMSADESFDLSPASKVVPMEADDGAFIFGDFAVAMPDDEPPPVRKPPATTPAAKTQAASPASIIHSKVPLGALPNATTNNSSSSVVSLTPKPPTIARIGQSSMVTSNYSAPSSYGGKPRNVVRQVITFGALIRDVLVSEVLAHAERVRGAVFASFAENCVVSSGGDHSAQLRPFRNDGTPLSLYFGHQDMILHVAITPDLNLVATSGSDGSLSIFEVSTSKRVGDSRHTVPVLCSSFSKNGKYIVSGAQDGVCRLWSSKKKQQSTPMSSYFGHKSFVTCISFQPNGEFVATGSGDTHVHVWSASTGKSNQILSKLHTHTIMNVQFSHDGVRLLTCDISKVALSDVATGTLLATLDANNLTKAPPPSAMMPFASKGGGAAAVAQAAAAQASKLMFTSATFAPQGAFPNYFFVATSDKQVALYEFVIKQNSGVGGSTSGSTTRAAPAPQKKNDKPTDNKHVAPDITVTISPQIWSWAARHRVAWLSTGPKMAVLVGDLGGNLTSIHLVPRQGIPVPVKAPLKVKLAK